MKKNIYEKLVKVLFFAYLAGMLSLGRAFAVIRIIKIGPIPIFVTELFLLIAAPLVLFRRKKTFELPKKFLIALAIFFLIGVVYLGGGVLRGNLYSLRDIVFCGYILFLPLTLITFSKKKDMVLFLGILFVCNLIGLALGRLWMIRLTSSLLPTHFTSTLKTFNLGLYYGITVSFLIAFFGFIKNKWYKLLILFLVALNIYILTFFKARTIEVAAIALTIFFLLVFWRNFLKIIIYVIPIIIIFFSILSYYDSDFSIRLSNKYVSAKGDMKDFLKKYDIQESLKSPFEESLEKSSEEFLEKPSEELLEKPSEEFLGKSSKDAVSREIFASSKAPKSVSKKSGKATPEGILFSEFPSARLGIKNNLVWRLDTWYQAIRFGLKSPFIGRGFGVYPRYGVWKLVKPAPRGIGLNSKIIPTHNHLVSIFYKMGLLGLGLFLFINGCIFMHGLRYIKKCSTDFTRCFLIGSLGSLVFWHTSALFFDVIDSPPTSIFLWIIIGLIFSIVKVDKESHEYQPKAKTKFTNKSKVVSICGIKVNIIQIPEVIKTMEGWIKSRNFGNYIAVSNALDVALGKNDSKIRDAVNNSSLSIPDGISLVLAARAYGYDLEKRVYGPDLLLEFLRATQDKNYSHFFYGTTKETLERLVESLKKQFPKLRISGTHPSFFREITAEEKIKVAKIINDSSVDVLWVGVGCPRQALWMQDFRDRLKVPVMVGVGAAFDFLSGTKPQAPRWMRDNGFEWLFRLITEPKRLWKRYLVGNSIFLWLFLKEFIKVKILKKDISFPDNKNVS